MARPVGSYGVIRREFEQELIRFCDEERFSLGYAAGVMIKRAFDRNDEAAFSRLCIVADRYLTDVPKEVDPQGELIPVIDRRRSEKTAELEHAAEDAAFDE
jgi:hypothetical protein